MDDWFRLTVTYEKEIGDVDYIDENMECVQKSGNTMEVSVESVCPEKIVLFLPWDSAAKFGPEKKLNISRCEGDSCQLCGIGISIDLQSGATVHIFCYGAGRGNVIRFTTDGNVVRFCDLAVYERRPQ